MNKKLLPIIVIGLVVVVLIGVFLLWRDSRVSKESPQRMNTVSYSSGFPMPRSVSGFTENGDQINYQTNLSLKEAEEFYRTELVKMGLTERTINTAVTDTTFSMVFDGYSNGKQIVIQGVDIQGKSNVNVRFEEL